MLNPVSCRVEWINWKTYRIFRQCSSKQNARRSLFLSSKYYSMQIGFGFLWFSLLNIIIIIMFEIEEWKWWSVVVLLEFQLFKIFYAQNFMAWRQVWVCWIHHLFKKLGIRKKDYTVMVVFTYGFSTARQTLDPFSKFKAIDLDLLNGWMLDDVILFLCIELFIPESRLWREN